MLQEAVALALDRGRFAGVDRLPEGRVLAQPLALLLRVDDDARLGIVLPEQELVDRVRGLEDEVRGLLVDDLPDVRVGLVEAQLLAQRRHAVRSEEHTSELQSLMRI